MSRATERRLLVSALGLVAGAALLLAAHRPGSRSGLALFVGAYAVSLLAIHVGLTYLAPSVDEFLLPLAGLVGGFGLLTLWRIQPGTAWLQLAWDGLGLTVALAGGAFFRSYRRLTAYRYLAGVGGLLLVAITLLFGRTIGGARAWLAFGPLHFEPSEVTKVLLVLFLAGYLDDTKELLAVPGRPSRWGIRWPNMRYLGPVLLFWGVAMLLLVGQNDLGAAVLLFGIFLTQLYVATGRRTYVGVALLLAGVGGFLAYRVIPHVRVRVALWLNPWSDPHGRGYQTVASLFSLAAGGVWGTGIGAGRPELIPAVTTDYAVVAWAEEWGFLGMVALILLFLTLVSRAVQIALSAPDDFGLLLGTGLATILAIQGATILGGLLRLIPLTGITMPFFSYGGTAAVTDFMILGLLGLISAERGRSVEPAHGVVGL